MLLYEALLGSRRVRGESALCDFVKGRKASLQQTLAARRKRGDTAAFVEKNHMPRYVRVNLLKTTLAKAKDYIVSCGYSWLEDGASSSSSSSSAAAAAANSNTLDLPPHSARWDPLLPGVIALPPKTSLHGVSWLEDGRLVLQDRSSCLTAIALSPPPGSVCIDTCSAPGNKTLHIASIMRGQGKIFAFERSPPRLATLERRVQQQGAGDFIKCLGMDFMEVEPLDPRFKDVTHVLIDPSCSGSGLVNMYKAGSKVLTGDVDENAGVDPQEAANIAQLTRNQLSLILHAMKFPSVESIAYSTCSVHKEENECIVKKVLEANADFECVRAVPNWPNRGLKEPEFMHFADLVVRATFQRDSTNGFFVARFERIKRDLAKKDKKDKKEKKEDKKEKFKDKAEKRKKPDDDDVPAEAESENGGDDVDEERRDRKKAKKEKKRKKREKEALRESGAKGSSRCSSEEDDAA